MPTPAVVQTASRRLAPLVPTPVWLRLLAHRVTGRGEFELRAVASLLGTRGMLVDVGANDGPYSAVALALGRPVVAFEPIPEVAAALDRRLRHRATIHRVALSDHEGVERFYLPERDGAVVTYRAALDAETHADLRQREVTVAVATLDSFHLTGVALVKIDVEGHEARTLAGSLATVEREHPALLVEVEEYRSPGSMDAVRSMLDDLGYAGWFWLDGRRRPLDEFRLDVHQRPDEAARPGQARSARFVNNFVWLPPARPLGDQPAAR